MGFKKFPNGGFGVVARTPRAVGEHFFREIFHNGVENDTVTVLAYQGRVSTEFFKDMLVGVVAVQAHEDFGVIRGDRVNLLDDFRSDAGALDHLYARGQRMGFDRLPVMWSNIDIDAEDFSL